MTVAEMAEDPPIAIVAGVAVAEELNVVDEFTVIVAAAEFQFHCCQFALNTPTSTVYVPASAGVNVSEYGCCWLP